MWLIYCCYYCCFCMFPLLCVVLFVAAILSCVVLCLLLLHSYVLLVACCLFVCFCCIVVCCSLLLLLCCVLDRSVLLFVFCCFASLRIVPLVTGSDALRPTTCKRTAKQCHSDRPGLGSRRDVGCPTSDMLLSCCRHIVVMLLSCYRTLAMKYAVSVWPPQYQCVCR